MKQAIFFDEPSTQKPSVLEYSTSLVQELKNSNERLLLSTSFGPSSAVLLKLVTDIIPEIPVVWVDTGYNTPSTYRLVDQLQKRFSLDLHIYQPARSAPHRRAVLGEPPGVDDDGHSSFTEETKLEPFRRALVEHSPHYWLSGVRAQDNEHRRTMGVSSPGPLNTTKIAPLFHWSDTDMEKYMLEHNLPNEMHYYDPTKVTAARECGLHCKL